MIMNQGNTCIYHERQMKELCALHALNNLFQDGNAFSKKEMDEICLRLSPNNFINPHKSMFGRGNYDVNVIMAAVQKKNCETVWFDKRKSLDILVPHNIIGFILNISSEYKLGFVTLPFKRKHWIAFKNVDGSYYNLDSKLEYPELIGSEETLIEFLKNELEDGEKELLLIVDKSVEKSSSWKQPETQQKPSENGK